MRLARAPSERAARGCQADPGGQGGGRRRPPGWMVEVGRVAGAVAEAAGTRGSEGAGALRWEAKAVAGRVGWA